MRFALFISFIFVGVLCFGQPANVTLKNGMKLKVVVTAVSEIQLFTNLETYSLNQIQAIYFWEDQPDSVSILTLRENGVVVYLQNNRLAPIPKPKAVRNKKEVEDSNASFGIGIGLDYGGVGTKFSLFPTSPLGLYAGVGYNFYEVGYNFGMDIKFSPQKRHTAFITAMYGYNAVVLDDPFKETYYGMSAGLGFKSLSKNSNKDYFNVILIYPFRDSNIRNLIKDYGFVSSPVLISIGYNFGF